MVIAWTQVAGTALSISASGAWTDYNIASVNGVPAGAVAFIVAANREDSANNIMGLRTNGSSLDRYLNMSEAEDGGANLIGWYVKVARDGYIEYYTADYANTSFYLMGYWTGVDYTEYFAELAFTTSGGTYAKNHFSMSSYSPAAGRVCTFALCNNRATTKETAGVRCGDAIYNKTISIHEAESGGVFGVFMATKTDASNQIEYYVESTTYVDVYVTGVFDGLMSYVDRHVGDCKCPISSANTWTDMDCSSYIGADGQVVDCVCLHNVVAAETNVGVRTNGTSDARYLLACEAEDNGYCGWTGPTKTDDSGIIEFYCGNASYELMGINGYYVPANIIEKTATESIGVSDATKNGKDLKASESIGSADSTAISKDFRVSESIGTVDVSPLDKTMKSAENVSLTDARLLSKALKVAESLGVTDSLKLTKAVLLADAVHATDAVTLAKLIKLTENISLAEIVALLKYKSFVATDTVGLSDSYKTSKTMKVADGVGAGDSPKLAKSMKVADTVGLVDANKLIKALMLADSIGATDAPKLIKILAITEAVGVADIAKLIKALKSADGIGVADASKITKALKALQSVGVADAVKFTKALKVSDSVNAAETLLDVVKHFVTSESVSLAEAVAFVKAVVASESISAADLKSLTKGIITKDYISEFDQLGLKFNGTNGFVTFSHASLDVQDSFTLSIRMKMWRPPINNTATFVVSGGSTDAPSGAKYRIIITNNGGTVNFGINTPGSWGWAGPSTSIAVGTEYFLTMVWDKAAQEFRAYVNGVYIGHTDFTYTALTSNQTITIGALNASYYWAPVVLRDFMIFDGARTIEQIQADMWNPPNGEESDLIAYWPLNEGSGTVVTDIGPNAISGTLNSGCSWIPEHTTFQKDLKQAEAVQVEDSNKLAKAMLVAEALHATDANILTKYAKVIEAVTSSDTNKLSKSLKVSEGISVADSVKLLKAILVAQAIGLADEAIVQSLANYQAFQVSESIGVSDASKIFKDFRVTETMGLADVAKLTKAMKVAEALSASDASKLLKSLIQSDTVHLADSRALTKVLKVAEAFGVSDVTKLAKVLKSIESIALSDASKLQKAMRTSDDLHTTDASKLSKDIKRADTISVADASKLGKDIHVPQGVGVSDATRLSKDLHGPESIGVADSISHLDKDFRTADGVHLADLNSLLKAFFSSEFIQVNDAGLLHKAFLIQESLTVDDAVALTKAIMVVEAIYLEELLELTGKVDWIYSLEGVVRERIDSLEGQVLEVVAHMKGGVTLEKYLEGLIDDEL